MLPRIRVFARWGYVLISWLFIGGVALQVFLAGFGLLVKFGDWGPHMHFGHLLGLPLLALILLSFLGRMPVRTIWTAVGLFALYCLQYVLINQLDLPVVRALHPVNALAIFYAGCQNALHAWRQVRGEHG